MIDTQAIRSKVLDLAMRGQLTEQLSEDGTAEELFQQIQTEKLSLIKAGKIKKEKPMPVISDDDVPFTIPKRWRWVYLGELFQHNTGKALNSSDTQGQQLEYITTSNLYWEHFELDGLKKMPFTEAEIEKCTVKKGDLLVCEGGDIGRSAIWPFDYDMRIQNHIHRLRRYSTNICTEFYYYLLWLYKQTGRINGIGIGLQGFSSNRVHSLIVPFAPYAEAERVVNVIRQAFSVLDTIDDLQAQYADNLSVLKSKLIDAAIQGKLTEQLSEDGTAEELYQQIQEEKQRLIKEGKIKKQKPLPEIAEDEIPFVIPATWKWVRLDCICYSVYAGKDKPGDFVKEKDENHRIPVVANAIANDGIMGYTSVATASAGTLTVAGRGTIGFTCYRNYDYCPIVRLLVINQSNLISPQYIKYVFLRLTVDSVGSSIPQLTVPMLRPKLIPLPPLAEQKRIVQKLNEILPICEKLK